MARAARRAARRSGTVKVVVSALLVASLPACSSGNRVVEVPDVERRTRSTPLEYQAELTATDEVIGVSMAAVSSADSLEALEFALGLSETAVSGAASRLGVVPSPPDVRLAHLRLLPGLRSFAQGLSQVGMEVGAHQICAAPAVMARIGGLIGVAELRAVSTALASNSEPNSYEFGASLPEAVEMPDRQVPNGTVVLDRRGTGVGSLEISNTNGSDAVVTLVGELGAVVSVFVAEGQTAVLDRIPPNAYTVYYTTGVDWDSRLQTFTRDCAFLQVDQPFDPTVMPTLALADVTATEISPADYPGDQP